MSATLFRRIVVTAVATGAVFAAVGCSSDSSSPPTTSAAPASDGTPMGHVYESTAVDGTAIPGGGPMTLTFKDGRVSANSGCNTASGPIDLTGNVIHVDRLAGTLMACGGDASGADAWQSDFLEASPTWQLTKGQLTLTTPATTVRLTDKEILHPDKPLVGTKWTVTALLTPQSNIRSAVIDDIKPGFSIAQDGSISGTAGCNHLGGTAKVGPGDTVTFATTTTRMACPPEVMDVEQNVLRALDGTAHATVDADTLTLRNDNGYGLTLTAS
ncbi:META domain-containing protein [Nocardia camponoti]|uniref:META domain-containing protein n=1 Tax=Nocardia camponoti TaxID=1616106 RepID=A0A917QAI5_9NOCA|nr:META domain-containing protein [Nocardia camponoti]GGK39112.1 META domain-containing protein [Nocardia camponoti]